MADLRAWARSSALEPFVRGLESAEACLGVRPALELGVLSIAEPSIEGRLAVLFEDAASVRTALAIDLALASVLVDRAMGGNGEGLEGTIAVPGEVERGILAYVFARWMAGSGLHVAAVLTTGAALRAAMPKARARWPCTIAIGSARGSGAFFAADRTLQHQKRLPRSMDDLRVEVVVDGGIARLDAQQLSQLARGDVVVLDAHRLVMGRTIEGVVRLHGGVCGEARFEDGKLRIVSTWVGRARTEGRVDSDKKSLEKIGTAPVTLTLELARFTLPLSELAALAPGEVVRVGRKIGEHVELRAGDRTIASGELVDVDGEIGVRVLEVAG